MTIAMRVQTGIGLFADGWHVVQKITMPDGQIDARVYEPALTEGEASERAAALARSFKELVDDRGGRVEVRPIVHGCPPAGSSRMPCCGLTPLEVPIDHRITLDPELVTCNR